MTMHNAGHVSGSAMFLVENRRNGRRLVYTGDFKTEPQALQKGAAPIKCDVLITESTYATRRPSQPGGLYEEVHSGDQGDA